MKTAGSAHRLRGTAGLLIYLVLAVPGAAPAFGAGGDGEGLKAVGSTGKRLPGWIKEAVTALIEDLPTLPVPPGYTVGIDDIVLIDNYRRLVPVLSAAQLEFLAKRSAPAFLVGHRSPICLIRQSPDLEFVQSLWANGLPYPAILLTKSIIAHEVMHVWYDPRRGMSDRDLAGMTAEQFERLHEIAACELQLLILRRDLDAGKYQIMQASFARLDVDLTTEIESKLTALKSGLPMPQFVFLGTRPALPVVREPSSP